MSENRVIGRDNQLPWRLPADLAHFKSLTLDKPIIMGRRTWESLPGLLPRRHHIVVTTAVDYRAEGCTVVHSIEQAMKKVDGAPEAMVIGGAVLYAQMLPMAERMYLTLVHARLTGDRYFPDYPPADWRELAREEHAPDAKNSYAYAFVTLERVPR